MKRPNVLWLMSDQHNANCMSLADHPDVRTPNLDRIAKRGVTFTQAFCNNPICAPSRISFVTGQYCHSHRLFGNDNRWLQETNSNTLPALFRRHGYQTALIGKSHMVPAWDKAANDRIRYTDLIDAEAYDPLTCHYFQYLDKHGLTNQYRECAGKKGMGADDGREPSPLPYEHSIERFTGREALSFLEERDTFRPFFLHMSFQRPHGPISPAPEHFDMYDPDSLTLPESAVDFFENDFASKPEHVRTRLLDDCIYPLAVKNPNRLRRCLASYYALISEIDMEIGRVLEFLEQQGELDNTIIFYTADHGDFAGEHGLFHKNLGCYESIHRIPYLLSWPEGPRGEQNNSMVEAVDWFPTICELCGIAPPEGIDGRSVLSTLSGITEPKEAVFSEFTSGQWGGPKWVGSGAVRTNDWRMVYYQSEATGELYDRRTDPGEIHNLWNDTSCLEIRLDMVERLLRFTMGYAPRLGPWAPKYSPTQLVQFGGAYWSDLKTVYDNPGHWPPPNMAER